MVKQVVMLQCQESFVSVLLGDQYPAKLTQTKVAKNVAIKGLLGWQRCAFA